MQHMSLLQGCWIVGLTSHQFVSSCEVSFQRCLAQEMHRKQQTMKGQPGTCRDGGVLRAPRGLGSGQGREWKAESGVKSLLCTTWVTEQVTLLPNFRLSVTSEDSWGAK